MWRNIRAFCITLAAVACSACACSLTSPLLTTTSSSPITSTPKPGTPKAWAIGIVSGAHPLSMREDRACLNPRFTKDDVREPRSLFVADPFLVRSGEKWRLFFELFNSASQRGEIGLAESLDLCNWSFKGVVLSEPFHLSYPFVFRAGGAYYMIPESRQSNGIRLYKATHFPTRWRLEKVLVDGEYSDSTPVYFNGKWWLFANRSPYTLVVLYADSLTGPWRYHPEGPFYEDDPSRARPAGRPVVIDGTLIRFVQDNRGGYGKRVRAMVVDRLTTSEFREHVAEPDPLFDGQGGTWSKAGVHHVSPVAMGTGRWIAVIDGNRDE